MKSWQTLDFSEPKVKSSTSNDSIPYYSPASIPQKKMTTSASPPAKRLKLASPPALTEPTDPVDPTPEAANTQNDNTVVPTSTSLELKVGITEYLNPSLPGFTGVLKQRYTDFLVNEITPEGEVVHLRSLDVPRREREKEGKRAEEKEKGKEEVEVVAESIGDSSQVEQRNSGDDVEVEGPGKEEVSDVVTEGVEAAPTTSTETAAVAAPAESGSEATISPEDHAELLNLLGAECLTTLLTLHNTLSSTDAPGAAQHSPILTPKIDSKDSRTSLHRSIRRIFSGKLETTTLEGTGNEGIISITVSRNAGRTSRGGRPERGGRGGKRGGRDSGRGGDRGERVDPYPNGQYLHFTLHKENRDTMDVVNMLGRILNLPRQLQQKTFAFAGTKDKRAVTVQKVSAYKINPERLAAANWPSAGGGRGGGGRGGRGGRGGGMGAAGFGLPRGCKVGDFEWRKAGLELGELKGNQFLITLRDICPTDSTPSEWPTLSIDEQEAKLRNIVGAAMDGLEKNGFINYYGLQRFGTFAKGTHEVGIKMLRMDWKGAVDEIMHFDPALSSLPDEAAAEKLQVSRDEFDRARALQIFTSATSNPTADDYGRQLQQALFTLPKKFLAENAIINAAKDRVGGGGREKLDWLQCLMRIPRGLRLMYIHSYQSWVWNHVASERIRRFGREGVVEGDLVLIDTSSSGKVANEDEDADMEDDLDQDGEPIVRDTSSTSFQSLSAKLTKEEGLASDSGFQRARPLTADEAASGKYTIRDIVLPTPGYDIAYPANELQQVYVELMARDGLDPMQMRRSVREVSLSGAYRKILGGVLGPVEWDVKRVRGVEQCVVTDLERVMEARKARRGGGGGGGGEVKGEMVEVVVDAGAAGVPGQAGKVEEGKAEVAAVEEEEEEREKLAVVLNMQLGTSMYATMALREVMKAGGVQSYQPEFGHSHGQGQGR